MTASSNETRHESGAQELTDKVWNRLRHGGRRVRNEVTGNLPPILRPQAWKQFKQMPLARAACSLLSLLEPRPADCGLYRRRTRRPVCADLFDDISSPIQRERAQEIFARLCARHSTRLPSRPWLVPILAGRARWMAMHPDAHGSAWGRRMRRQKGGKHTQRRYQEQGRHPLPSVLEAWNLRLKLARPKIES